MSTETTIGQENFNKLKKYTHIYALFAIILVAVYTRVRNYASLYTDNGQLALLGNDSWYHYRAVQYSIENFPFTIGVDGMSGYPEGADVGTFGTLYDQIIAAIALILGLGNPSDELVRQILVFSSPAFAVLTILMIYKLTQYITSSKWAGVLAGLFIGIMPSMFYDRTIVGFAQHHVLEVLFLFFAIYMIMKAINYAERENISIELLKEPNTYRRQWLKYVLLSGFAIALYFQTWPPGMVLFAIIALAAGISFLMMYPLNENVESSLLTISGILFISTLIVLANVPRLEFSVSNPSILHLTVVSVSFIGVVYLTFMSRFGNEHDYSIAKIIGISVIPVIVLIGILAVVIPELLSELFNQVLRLFGYPFDLGGETVQTIAEEQSTTIMELTLQQYGLLLLTAIIGFGYLFVHSFQKKRKVGFTSNILLLTSAVFFLLISIRTIRFNYYLSGFVAIFAAITIKWIFDFVGVPKITQFKDVFNSFKGYHLIAILLVITLIIPIVVLPVESSILSNQNEVNIHDYQEWEEPLQWLSNNSEQPDIGLYETSNSQPFEYTEDTYGVMSWWDYGHWITVTGERPAIANPFQQHATEASEFLLADNSEDANQIMTDLNENADAKYVAIDWQMASPFSKFNAITEWNDDVTFEDYVQPYYITSGQQQQVGLFERSDEYYNTMLARLYYGHGSQMEPGPYTIDYSITETQDGQSIRSIVPEVNPIEQHDNVTAAQEYADNNTEVTFNGFGMNPPEKVEALNDYRLVKSSPNSSLQNQPPALEYQVIDESTEEEFPIPELEENPSSVKIFEHVEGATIEGEGAEPEDELDISVTLSDPVLQSIFTYDKTVESDITGTFEFTVPYSTSEYENVSNTPEVQAVTDYTVQSSENNSLSTSFDVPEENVVSDDIEPIQIELEEETDEE